MAALRIGVMGAGAIGGYVGVRLSAAGFPVVLVSRRPLSGISSLEAVPLKGPAVAAGPDLRSATEPAALRDCDVVLLCTKSGDTEEAARGLAEVLAPGTPVVSLQNGLFNRARIDGAAPALDAVAGMVTFNVVRREDRFEQGTSGPVLTGAGGAGRDAVRRLVEALTTAGEASAVRADIEAIQAGKLLLNLNNGICAVTGLPVRASLEDRRLRRVLAEAITEGRVVLRAAGRAEAAIGILSPALIARLLPMPDAIFHRLAKRMLTIDPKARSSTLQDLDRNRPTEIDDLNGAIVTLARAAKVPAPINELITDEVHRLEREGRKKAFLTTEALVGAIAERTSTR